MRYLRSAITAILAALVPAIVVVWGCAAHEELHSVAFAQRVQRMRDEVSRVVADPARRERLRTAIDQFEIELKTFNESVSGLQRSLRALNADPNASRAQFGELIDRYETERKSSRLRLTQIHREFLALTTEAEWDSIALREAEILQPDQLTRVDEGEK